MAAGILIASCANLSRGEAGVIAGTGARDLPFAASDSVVTLSVDIALQRGTAQLQAVDPGGRVQFDRTAQAGERIEETVEFVGPAGTWTARIRFWNAGGEYVIEWRSGARTPSAQTSRRGVRPRQRRRKKRAPSTSTTSRRSITNASASEVMVPRMRMSAVNECSRQR